jgi:DNA (cytosine-5)-methyltransferase 1
MGWETVAFVEKEPFCQKVLRKNFGAELATENTENTKGKPLIYGDIFEFSGKPFRGRVDIVTGGFPCQPFSHAGNQRGSEDDRYLWHEMHRVIQECRPRWIVGENVVGLINMELDNVLSDLEVAGYTTEAVVIPACAVDAPHRRERVWILGYSDEGGESGLPVYAEVAGLQKSVNATAYASSIHAQRRDNGQRQRESWRGDWWKTSPAVCRDDDGVSNRVHRLKALGNSIVPQIAFEIFKAIEAAEK